MKNKYVYFLGFSATVAALISIMSRGHWTYFALLYGFAFIPLVELFVAPDSSNFNKEEEEEKLEDPFYDNLLYTIVPFQYMVLLVYLIAMTNVEHTVYEMIGKTLAMGISCGTMGINVGHELGHRNSEKEQWMSKALLFTALYGHFFVEHNKGHHKRVSTPDDPASAQYGENVYSFMFRSVVGSFLSAWEIEAKMMKKENKPFYSWSNQMVQILFGQGILMAVILVVFGLKGLFFFVASATIGFLLLEVVNYIEHYGLSRKLNESGRYEKVLPAHSWNSNHILGRAVLFELSRHSDHHANASKKYQILNHYDDSPQMPTGYPGMVLLALVPPLWFKVMHKQIEEYKESGLIA